MTQFLQIALGILSAIGGFVDIGDLAFNTQAGATFGFLLLWVVVCGVRGIIAHSASCAPGPPRSQLLGPATARDRGLTRAGPGGCLAGEAEWRKATARPAICPKR